MCLASGIYWDCVKTRRSRTGLWRVSHFVVVSVLLSFPWLASCSAKPASLDAIIAQKTGVVSDNYIRRLSSFVEVNGWTFAVVRGDAVPHRIYIEGDGRAYISKGQPSDDPTPVNPVALRLMLADKEAGAMYVARPCQWVKGPECKDRTLWTEGRFTKNVVDRYVQLVARESMGQPVELVGYSGGAFIALQVAARLPNVSKVVAIAGNLMPDWVNEQHKVTKIPVVPYPPFKRDLPVMAYVGINDLVVGGGVVRAFEAETGLSVEVIEVQATHGTGWDGLVIGDK